MVLRKTLLYMPAGILGPLVQLGTIVALTFWLPPEELGLYALVVALQDLAQIATLSWWSQYVLRYLDERHPALRARQDRTEIALVMIAGAMQAFLIAGLMLAIRGGPIDATLLASAAAAGVARALVVHWSVRARAAQQIGLHAFAQIAGPLLSLALTLAGFILFGASLAVAFLAMALGYVLVALPMAPRLAYSRIGGGIDRPTLATAFRYGVYTALGTGLSWASMQSVRFITDIVLGAAAVGLLHVGWGIGQRIATQLGVLATAALFPMAASTARAEGDEAGVRQLMVAGPVLLAVLTPATIGLFFVSEPFARLLTAPGYQEATAAILPWAMLAGAVRTFRNNYLDEILQLTDRSRLMTALDGVEAVTTLLLCSYGAVLNGVQGAIIGCVISAVATTAIASVVIARRHGPPLTLRSLVVTGSASAVMVMTLNAMPTADDLAGLIAVTFASAASYLFTFGIFESAALFHFLKTGRHGSKSGFAPD